MANMQLADQLITMAAVDQKMRERAIKDESSFDSSIDKGHAEKLQQIVKKYGWPTISLVGKEASHAAWLLIQHADHDVIFQKTCLQLMKSAKKGEVKLSNIAYLEDRVRVAGGKPQLYGTQFDLKGSKFGAKLILDRGNLDKRREAMGLSTYKEYKELMTRIYR